MSDLIEHINRLKTASPERYNYTLETLVRHLSEADHYPRLRALFDNHDWMHVRFEGDGYVYNGYIEDLALAWEKHAHLAALQQIDTGDEPKALVECLRYALIRTSINARAKNFVPELVARAVQTGLWSPQRALNIAAIIPVAVQRAWTYVDLLKTGKLNMQSYHICQTRLLETALSIETENDKVSVLCALAPYATKELLEQALVGAAEIIHLTPRTRTVSTIASYLDDNKKNKIMQQTLRMILLSSEPQLVRDQALIAVGHYLEGQLLEQAIPEVLSIRDSWNRRDFFVAIAPRLKGELLDRGWEIIFASKNEQEIENILDIFLPIVVEKLSERSLAGIFKIKTPHHIYNILLRFASRLMKTLPQESLAWVLTIKEAGMRSRALERLIPYADHQNQMEILNYWVNAVKLIEDAKQQNEAFSILIPYLSGEKRLEMLRHWVNASKLIKEVWWQEPVLANLIPHLKPEDRSNLLDYWEKEALAAKDTLSQINMLAMLMPHLTQKRKKELLNHSITEIPSISDETQRATALIRLAPYLEDNILDRALVYVEKLESDTQRSKVLETLILHSEDTSLDKVLLLLMNLKQTQSFFALFRILVSRINKIPLMKVIELLEGILVDAFNITIPEERIEALLTLVPYLQENRKMEALNHCLSAIREADIGQWKDSLNADRYVSIFPHLDGQLLKVALADVLKIKTTRPRAKALYALVPHLIDRIPQDELSWILATVDLHERVWLHEKLSAYSTQTEGPKTLEDQVNEALDLDHPISRAKVLALLAPYLQGRILDRALTAGVKIDDEASRVRILAMLVPYLQASAKDKAVKFSFETSLRIKNGSVRATTLALITPYVEGELVEQALVAALEIPFESERDRALKKDAIGTAAERARSISESWDRMAPFVALAPRLKGDLLREAVAGVLRLDDEWERKKGIIALIPSLEGDLLEQCLNNVTMMTTESYRNEVLDILSSQLNGTNSSITSTGKQPQAKDDVLGIAKNNRIDDQDQPIEIVDNSNNLQELINQLLSSKDSERKSIFEICVNSNLPNYSRISSETLSAIAWHVIDISDNWQWQ